MSEDSGQVLMKTEMNQRYKTATKKWVLKVANEDHQKLSNTNKKYMTYVENFRVTINEQQMW